MLRNTTRNSQSAHSGRRRIGLSVACALTLTVGAAAGPALASYDSSVGAAPPTGMGTQEGANTATGKLPALLNPSTATVKGERVAPGACKYTSTLRLAADEVAVREDTIGLDSATCTMTVRRGTPADAPKAPTASDGASTMAIVGHSAGFFKTYLTDPPGWEVNSVRDDIDWFWNGSLVGQKTCKGTYGWLAASGWQKVADNHSCIYENGQTRARSSSFAHYLNPIFCGSVDTRSEYNRNNVYGLANGVLEGRSSVVAWGGCTGLLTARKELRRTL